MQVDPKIRKFATKENGRLTIYTMLNKALYGTVQASLLFWTNLSSFLTQELGFETNPYYSCVANKTINGHQMTIGWHFDNLKISHKDL